nr:hypothetical protein [Tanacetum cinerariifolium]
MTTLAEYIIVAEADNRPPMLEKSMYNSWLSRIRLFIKGKKHGRMMLDSINNGPLVYPTVEENGQTRPKKYSELTEAQQIQDDFQVNTKFLNALPSEWGKFVIDMKLAKSLYTTNYDQLYAYLSKHERHAIERGEDLIECINKAMAFLSAVASRQSLRIQLSRQTTWMHMARIVTTYLSSAKTVLMTNLSSCDPEVLSKVSYSDFYPNDMINQDVQEMRYYKQTHVDDCQDNKMHIGRNIIPYSQYLQESQDAVIQDTNPSAPNDLLVISLVEQMTDHVAHLDKENQTNKMVNESLTAELERYKERIAIFEQRLNVDLNKREKLIDSQMDDIILHRNAKFAAFQ